MSKQFSIKLANGFEGEFDSAVEMSDFFDRMSTRPIKKRKRRKKKKKDPLTGQVKEVEPDINVSDGGASCGYEEIEDTEEGGGE